MLSDRGSLRETQTLAERQEVYSVSESLCICVSVTSAAPGLVKVTLDLPLDSVVLSSWICSPSTLSGVVSSPTTCVWGGWQVLGLFLELYNKVKLSDLDGVWNHDLGPMLHYNQLS